MADNGGARRRAGRRWVLWIVAGVAAAGAVVAVLGIWHLPDRMYPPGTEGGAEARAALQGGLLTAAAALLAVAGGLVALDETRQANAETKRANRDTHVRELYVEAAKLLNDPDNLGVRLAGIYALERIAVDSPPDQRTVVEVLSAFVRTRSTDPALRPPPPADDQEPPEVRPAADIRAAVQVLGRLPLLDGVPRCDLNGADLTGPASLAGLTLADADLTEAWLVGADLTEAWLAKAKLTRAVLGAANLTGAVLGGAKLTSAVLVGTDLTRAFLGAADLICAELDGANLTGAVLDKAHLVGARDLTAEQVAAAQGSAETSLPDGVARPGSWPPYDPFARPGGGS
ncbi:pentapeptide repeat-containing protein [Frankia sp. ACN1ag]|uniref:pentapeptide repeat-containing protein n=1 Tax=Frankia sp. ACN1ag TaxID=102891 RepID=UPI0006DCB26E|nr:pentapeptide repeat-containing protein [Frankia sp. ACN1ag]KQC35065.1 hypothetical protein UK82_28810 [Frankia sp. ACN1ag]